jgi:arabinofuranan 3-O-arabinosyltransferase
VTDADGRAVTGFAIDMLSLRSAGTGSSGTGLAPDIKVERPSRLTWKLSTVSTAHDPYWIVMGQSISDGWVLRTEDGSDLGPPRLINGYAAGWLIDGNDLKSQRFTIDWAPQRAIWWALAVSAVGALVCLAIILWPLIRPLVHLGEPRRDAAAERAATARSSAGTAYRHVGEAGTGVTGAARVRVISPFDRFGVARSQRVVGLTFLVTAVLATIACGPFVGLPLAALTAAAMRWSRAWIALRLTAMAALVLSVAYIVAKQFLNSYGLGFEWAVRFEATHLPVLFAVAALFCDVVVEAVRAGWRRSAHDHDS